MMPLFGMSLFIILVLFISLNFCLLFSWRLLVPLRQSWRYWRRKATMWRSLTMLAVSYAITCITSPSDLPNRRGTNVFSCTFLCFQGSMKIPRCNLWPPFWRQLHPLVDVIYLIIVKSYTYSHVVCNSLVNVDQLGFVSIATFCYFSSPLIDGQLLIICNIWSGTLSCSFQKIKKERKRKC